MVDMNDNKFFLDYCQKSVSENKMSTARLHGKEKKLFNEMLDAYEHVTFVLIAPFEDRLNFLLFCAAANNEL